MVINWPGWKAPPGNQYDYAREPRTLEEAFRMVNNIPFEENLRKGREDAAAVLQHIPCGRALDFGCGVGRVLKNLPSDRFWGYEPNPGMRRFAEEWLRESGHRVLGSLQGVGEFFDAAFEIVVFQHIPPPDAGEACNLLRRILKPWGLLFCHDTHPRVPEVQYFRYVKTTPFFDVWIKDPI